MKRILTALFAVLMVVSLVACAGGNSMTMGTGGTSGTYYGYGSILGQFIQSNTELGVTVVSTDGSKANIQGVQAGSYQLATVQSDVMSYAWNGTGVFENDGKVDAFRVVAGLYQEAVQLVTVDPEVKTVADLKGKAVSIGAAGSGVYFNAIDVLSAVGLTEDDIDAKYQDFATSADSLKDGKIQAAFIVAGAPTPAITELCSTNPNTRIVPVDGEVAKTLMDKVPFYTAYTIPAGTYRDQTEDVTTVAVKATLIVSADATEDEVYGLTKAIFDNVDAITEQHPKGAELSFENATAGIDVPFHAGAAKFFAENGITVSK
ncbi:MAG: TAXI family TRAP transporter solute-binding subunit [Clostridia bacterium]|nr:TAXI family TRAP transporter solute-binding subunit [Clostridia bacterium]